MAGNLWNKIMIERSKFIIDGAPVSQVRHSFNGKRTFYNPKFMKKKKEVLKVLKAQKAFGVYPSHPFINQLIPAGVPVKIDFLYVFERPKRLQRKKDNPKNIHHISKPDIDNLDKFYCDCLSGIAYEDDNQIAEISSRKIYTTFDFKTKESGFVGTIISVYELPELGECLLNPDSLPW